MQVQRSAGQLQSSKAQLGDQYSHSTDYAHAVRAHRRQYDQFLRQSRKQRSRSRKPTVLPEEDRELGIKATAGLGKGDRPVAMPAEPLWLADNHLPAACTVYRGFSQSAAAALAPHPVRPRRGSPPYSHVPWSARF